MSETKLKPCPFCGDEAEIIPHTSQFSIRCTNSNCILKKFWYKTVDEAVKMWNGRYIVKELKKWDKVFYISRSGHLCGTYYDESTLLSALIRMGNLFLSEEEALKHKDEIMKKYEETISYVREGYDVISV